MDELVCCENGCTEKIKDNRWAKTKAHAAGWFFEKDGKLWCLEHVPDWVRDWRERSRNG